VSTSKERSENSFDDDDDDDDDATGETAGEISSQNSKT
jgi:hypothetical protein